MESKKCNFCKEYYTKHEYCSQCKYFLETGIVKQNSENLILSKLADKYLDVKKINHFMKIVLSTKEISNDDLLKIMLDLDIYIKYEHANAIFNILKRNNDDYNCQLIHILSFKIIDFWRNKLGGPSCYYNNFNDKPKDEKNSIEKIKYNEEYFKRFCYN